MIALLNGAQNEADKRGEKQRCSSTDSRAPGEGSTLNRARGVAQRVRTALRRLKFPGHHTEQRASAREREGERKRETTRNVQNERWRATRNKVHSREDTSRGANRAETERQAPHLGCWTANGGGCRLQDVSYGKIAASSAVVARRVAGDVDFRMCHTGTLWRVLQKQTATKEAQTSPGRHRIHPSTPSICFCSPIDTTTYVADEKFETVSHPSLGQQLCMYRAAVEQWSGPSLRRKTAILRKSVRPAGQHAWRLPRGAVAACAACRIFTGVQSLCNAQLMVSSLTLLCHHLAC